MFPGRLLSTRVFYFGCAMPRASAYEDRAKNLPLQSAPILVSWRRAFRTSGNKKQACTDPHPWLFFKAPDHILYDLPYRSGAGTPRPRGGGAARAPWHGPQGYPAPARSMWHGPSSGHPFNLIWPSLAPVLYQGCLCRKLTALLPALGRSPAFGGPSPSLDRRTRS